MCILNNNVLNSIGVRDFYDFQLFRPIKFAEENNAQPCDLCYVTCRICPRGRVQSNRSYVSDERANIRPFP